MRHKLSSVKDGEATCSICGHVKIVRHGVSKAGRERWKCENKSKADNREKSIRRLEFNIPKSSTCDICGKTEEENGKRLARDHSHKTGKSRGWLCASCNLGLGSFNDSPNILEKAIVYLKEKEGC